jgi:hypothetical protein
MLRLADNPSWEDLINGYDDSDLDLALAGLPVAQFAEAIPSGEAEAFIDKNRRFFAFPSQQQNEDDRWYRSGDMTTGTVTGVDEVAAPVYMWVAFASTWLTKARWEATDTNATTGSLFVEFLSLAMVRYDNVPAAMWSDMCRSKSKGQWLYWNVAFCNGNKKGDPPGWPYQLLRFPSRKVTYALQQHNFKRDFSHGPTHHLNA